MMSIPRDLKVDIPGHGNDKINAAYALGGAAPDASRRSSSLFGKPGKPSRSTTSSNVNFGGFRGHQQARLRLRRHRPRLLQRQLGRRDSTRRSTSSPATRSSAARTRSTTSASATATTTSSARARQQDFLRQVRNAAGARRLLKLRDREASSPTLFARYTDTDKGLRRTQGRLLAAQARALHRPASRCARSASASTLTDDPVYLTASPGQARQDRRRVPQRPGLEEAAHHVARLRGRPQDRVAPQERATAPRRARARGRAPRGRGPGDRRRPPGEVPLLLPDAALPGLALRRHRAADLQHRGREGQEAPRLPPRRLEGRSSASTTASRARPGATRRSSTTRRRPARSTAASSSCTTTGAACGWSRGGPRGPSTGSRTRSPSRSAPAR